MGSQPEPELDPVKIHAPSTVLDTPTTPDLEAEDKRKDVWYFCESLSSFILDSAKSPLLDSSFAHVNNSSSIVPATKEYYACRVLFDGVSA